MRESQYPPIRLTALMLGLSLAYGAQAQNADQVLDPVQVTAQAGSATNTVVRANRIEVEQAVGLQDLFKQTPEVTIGGGGLPVAQKLYVRGLSERLLSVTIDGAAQPEAAYHHTGQAQVEPDLLKRVEVEAGTGAATAGPGALGGALRFTTKSAQDLLRPNERAGAILKGTYLSASETSKFGITAFGRLNEQIGILASASKLDGDDYEDGRGQRVANSATEAASRFVKLSGRFDGGHELTLSHERIEDEGMRNKRTNLILAGINPTQRQRFERESTILNYDLGASPLLNLHLNAYVNENAALLGLATPQFERDGTRTRGLQLANTSRIGSHKLTYGLDYRRDRGFANLAGRALADEQASVKGVFAHGDFALGEQWLLGAGVRHDRYDYTDMTGRRYDSSGSSPSASLTWTPLDTLSIRLGHARALRGVGVIEPFLKAFQTNAANLREEEAANTDLSVQWESGPWRANLTGFRQRIDNYIGFDDQRENLGDVRTRGYSVSAGWQAGGWSASLGVSHAKPTLNGRPLSSDEAFLLGNSAGRTWVAQLDHALPAQFLKLGWTSRAVERLEHVPTGAATKPGYAVHDVYAQWLPTGRDDLTLTLTVNNLGDKFYYDHSSFGFHPRWGAIAALPETGRNVRFSASWRL